jgi:nicotinamidase-related amidase
VQKIKPSLASEDFGCQTSEVVRDSSIVNKPTFGSIDLAKMISDIASREDIEIELIGLCTDICVVSNALMLKAFMPEVKISVDSACCAGVTPEKHEAALETMRSCQIFVE